MPRVLLVASTTGYQVRAFDVAADRVGVDLVLATDRCHVLDDPWRDRAVPVRFHDETASVETLRDGLRDRLVDGVLAVGDRPARLAAAAAAAWGLPGHSPAAARAAGNKLLTRMALRAAGIWCPWFTAASARDAPGRLIERVQFPCVVKPLALSGSQGVARADTPEELIGHVQRVTWLLGSDALRERRDPADEALLVEGYVAGREVAVEGLVTAGRLDVLAVFDKPDPLEGPFFEESIYVTPSALSAPAQRGLAETLSRAVSALGLRHGPVHAECRLRPDGSVFVLEVAARPIGGLCARALRFVSDRGELVSLEEVLLRHAAGLAVPRRREPGAAGVMMLPVPRGGRFRGVEGVEEARAVRSVEEIVITAQRDQMLRPAPDGATYPGFVFARADRASDVVEALRTARDRLELQLVDEIPLAPQALA